MCIRRIRCIERRHDLKRHFLDRIDTFYREVIRHILRVDLIKNQLVAVIFLFEVIRCIRRHTVVVHRMGTHKHVAGLIIVLEKSYRAPYRVGLSVPVTFSHVIRRVYRIRVSGVISRLVQPVLITRDIGVISSDGK